MANGCPPGKIPRSAYLRKDGTYVRSTCIPDKGLPGKTPLKRRVLPKPVAGNLSKYGYFDVKHTPASIRREALLRGVRDAGYATIMRRVNLVANFNKNNPPLHKIFRSDMAWMQKNLAPIYSKSSRRASMPTRKASRRPSRKATRKASKRPSRK